MAVVSFQGVYKYFKDPKGGIITAVDEVNLEVDQDEIIALVGESGSGKTTLGKLSVRLIEPSRGKILFDGMELSRMRREELWRRAQYIHQDPYSSLDPYMTVGEVLERPLRYLMGIKDHASRRETVQAFLDKIGIQYISPGTRINRLSGGERQRILISRAFIVKPKFVVADEPTTMIDFIHRNEILNLLLELKKENKSSMLFITHDLSLASYIADKIAIMYKGRIVEMGRKDDIIRNPLHPYTQALFSATPERLLSQEGPAKATTTRFSESFIINDGCRYAPICPFASERCRKEVPSLIDVGGGHMVACFKYE